MYINKAIAAFFAIAFLGMVPQLFPSQFPLTSLASLVIGLAALVVFFSYLWLGIRRTSEKIAIYVRRTNTS